MIPPFKINSQKTRVPRRLRVLSSARFLASGLFLVAISASPTSSVEAQNNPGRDAQAMDILKKSCADCHTPGKANGHDFDFILDPVKLIKEGLIDPSQPSKSEILRRISEKSEDQMPPKNAAEKINRPTDEEKKILEDWIRSLAPIKSPSDLKRKETPATVPVYGVASNAIQPKFVKEKELEDKELIEKAIRFLDTQPVEKRRSIRFFSFRNLYQLRNSPKALNPNFAKNSDLSDDHIALVKALNSLSWNSDFAEMDKVPGSDDLLVWVDLTTLKTMVGGKIASWTEEREWKEILKEYRYGYEVNIKQFKDLQNETGTPMPIIRADWFITNALSPPLYHQLLQIPENEKDLQTLLGLDIERNILGGQALRIGFTESEVSRRANRLIERHPTTYGYYWKSYDFLPPNAAPGNANAAQSKRLLKEFPTGPRFNDNKFNDTAFDHDGGEIIFSLPNRLQGYMLVQADGTRIDVAPQNLVNDPTLVSGSPSIVNGLSCIACHSQGMIDPPDDEIFDGANVKGDRLVFVRRLHRREEGKNRLNDDRERFMEALSAATKKWSLAKDRSSSTEPISRIAKNFNNGSLGLAELASELGVTEDFLSNKLAFDNTLRQIVPYSENQTIKREDWQSFLGLQTRFQRASSHLELGTPWKIAKKIAK
jgi:serine/threonine-protein kinase